jgi:hypothetical protein
MGLSKEIKKNFNAIKSKLTVFLVYYGNLIDKDSFSEIKKTIVHLENNADRTTLKNLEAFIFFFNEQKKLYETKPDLTAPISELIKLAKETKQLMEGQIIAEAKSNISFILGDDLLKKALESQPSTPSQPSAPFEVEKNHDDTKCEFTYSSKNNPGKTITHNYLANTIKAEGFDDNLTALLKTLTELAKTRKEQNNNATLRFQITEPKSLTSETLSKVLSEAGYDDNLRAFVDINISAELQSRNAHQTNDQPKQQTDASGGGLKFTVARTGRKSNMAQFSDTDAQGLENSALHPPAL